MRAAAMRRYREAALAAVAGLALIAYTYLTPPLIDPGLIGRLPWIGSLPGDLPAYALRFSCSFLLLGLLPLLLALALGERPGGLGLRRPRPLRPRWVYPLLAFIVLAGVFLGAYSPALFSYYPYSHTLALAWGWGGCALHALLYAALYYVPWELLFRGILLFPLVRLADQRLSEDGVGPLSGLPLLIVMMQAVISAMLHFGHPFSETLIALPFGILLGWLALRTGSLLPGLALHALAGIGQDLFNTLRLAGLLP
jgi:membrane protease YdiL (CAAX protease family)